MTTTTKTEAKATETRTKPEAKNPEEMQLAYQVHTLSQLVYDQLTTANPWMAPTFPPTGLEPPRAAWMAPMGPGGTGAFSTWVNPWSW